MRLTKEQISLIDQTSMELLANPGVLCYNKESAELLEQAGARLTSTREGEHEAWWVSIPAKVARRALDSAPSKVTLGARDQGNKLELNAEGGNVFFGTGSETNYWLEIEPKDFTSSTGQSRTFPTIKHHRGNMNYLCRSAHLSEHLDNLDFFIRNINIQDNDIDQTNKDVNVFFASLNHLSKHVMSGLVKFEQLEKVIHMAEIIAGGRDNLLANPIISFITSVIKSPLQIVDETAQKLIAVSRLGLPVVISSSPQGGSTAPVDEAGMVAQVNAEVLAGIVINQLARPGSPVIYGAVPVRARMDNLHDLYGVPEFSHYNLACAQMARYYRVPCYSTAGVGDARVPGLQAAAEKMFTHAVVPSAAPDLVHYAFGLLDKTQVFCPEQAVLDDHHIGMVKFLYNEPLVTAETLSRAREMVKEVMHSPYRLYARYTRRLLREGKISPTYPFESALEDQDQTLLRAHERVQEVMSIPPAHLPPEVCDQIFEQIPGLLPRLNPYSKA